MWAAEPCWALLYYVLLTFHRKGHGDGVGGTIKHLAPCASLQCPSEKQILFPMALFEFATKNIMGILFEFLR